MAHDLPVHVWTCVTGRWEQDAAPGILVAWRQREGEGWEGWVIVAEATQGTGQVFSRQSWVPASAIRPVIAGV